MQELKYPNIEAERVRKSISQEELAKKLGVERKSYYNWLKRGNIPAYSIIRFIRLFNRLSSRQNKKSNNLLRKAGIF